MSKSIRYYIWYFYFCIYWSAYNWGERQNPQSNASNLFSFIWVLFASIILQVIGCFGVQLSGLYFFCICGIPAFILPFILFKNKEIKSKRNEFDFLKANDLSRKRITVVVAVLLFLIALNAGIAIVRNINGS